MDNPRATLIILFVLFLTTMTACTSSRPPLDYVGPNMVDGPSVKAQRADCRMFPSPPGGGSGRGGSPSELPPHPGPLPKGEGECIRGMRMPPKGAVPANFEPYPYSKDEGELAGKMLRNPLRPTKAILLSGQKLFETYCMVCHGPKGDGAGSIVPKFPQPPPLFSEKVTRWPDGRIFHVMTRGQNLMSSYATQMTADERWAAVHYVRVLQRAAHPGAADLKRPR